MKKKLNLSALLTVIYVILLLALLAFCIVYLLSTKDFIQPISFTIDPYTEEYNIDEFSEYLIENNYMAEGVTADDFVVDTDEVFKDITTVRKYNDGTLVLYWDAEAIEKDNPTYYEEYEKYVNVGNMSLEGEPLIIVYGCFGVSYKEKAEDATAETYSILPDFPTKYSGNHGNLSAWDLNMDDLKAYFIQCGFATDDSSFTLMTTIGTENWICDHIDMIWWDVDNLVEGTEAYDYWKQYTEEGYIYFGGIAYVPVQNGPFAIKVNAGCASDANVVYEAFANFAKDYKKAEE